MPVQSSTFNSPPLRILQRRPRRHITRAPREYHCATRNITLPKATYHCNALRCPGGARGTASPRKFTSRQPPLRTSPRLNADRVGISLALRANITAQRAISRCRRQHITATLRVARVGLAGRLRIQITPRRV